jgi:hypothetical protein
MSKPRILGSAGLLCLEIVGGGVWPEAGRAEVDGGQAEPVAGQGSGELAGAAADLQDVAAGAGLRGGHGGLDDVTGVAGPEAS